MPELLENVADAALRLPVEARIGLVDKLLASRLNPVDHAIDAAWGTVAERRKDDLRSGRVKGITAEKVSQKPGVVWPCDENGALNPLIRFCYNL